MGKTGRYFICILVVSLFLVIRYGQPFAATINIDAGKTTGINPLIYGDNMQVSAAVNTTTGKGWGAWDTVNYKSVPAVVDFAQKEGKTILRFPGGKIAEEYHFEDGIGLYVNRPTILYEGWSNSDNKYGTGEHMAFSEEAGAEAMITVNTATGTAQEAAAWIAWLNGYTGNTTGIGTDKNGKNWGTVGDWAGKRSDPNQWQNGTAHSQPYNVKYVEIGNEVWNYYTVVEYSKIFREYYTALKAVDPDIKVGAVLEYNWSWWKTIMEAIGDQADFLILHYYKPFYNNDNAAGAPAKDVIFKAVLAAPLHTQDVFTSMRNVIERSPAVAAAGRAQDIEVFVTEYNTHFDNTVNSVLKDYQYSLGSALQQAESLNYFMNPDNKIGAANIWDFKLNVFGSVKGDGAYIIRPNHYIFTMYRDYFGPVLVNTTVTSDTYDSEGVTNIHAVAGYKTDDSDTRFRIRLQRDAGTNISGNVWYDDLVVRQSGSDDNLLLNPGFESDFNSWNHSTPDLTGSIDSSTSRSGTRSFTLSFAGGSDPAYDGMYQDITITTFPNPTRYQIEGYIKTQGINIDPVNLLLNPSFENNFTSWAKSTDPAGAATSIDSTQSHSGSQSAKVVFDGTKDVNYYHTIQTVPVNPATPWYIVEGYIKTEGITGTQGVCLELKWVDKDNMTITKKTVKLTGDNDWTYVAVVTKKLDSSATQLMVRLRRVSGSGNISGTAWWDDIRIWPLQETYSPNIKVDVYHGGSIGETLTLDGLAGTHDWVQKRTAGTPYLSARASMDGNILYLMVVNKDLANDITAAINISGFSPLPSSASVLTLNGPAVDSTNESSRTVKVTPSSISNVSTSFNYTFPAHSLTAIGFGRPEPLPSPVAHWKMDEASWNGTAGEVIDSSGYGDHGAAAGNAAAVAPGAPRGNGPMAGSFDGNGDHITVPDNAGLTITGKNDLSITFWLKANELTGIFQDLVSKSGSASYQVMLAWDNKIKISLMQPAFTPYSSGHIPPLNEWEHVAVAVDFTALQVRWYVNGILLTTNTLTNMDMKDPGGALVIADMTATGNERPYDGLLDDVRIYDIALTAEQIARIYNNTIISVVLRDAYDLSDYILWNIGSGKETNTVYIMDAGNSVLVKNNGNVPEDFSISAEGTYWTLGGSAAENTGVLMGLFNGSAAPVEGDFSAANDLITGTTKWATQASGIGSFEGISDGDNVAAGSGEKLYIYLRTPSSVTQGNKEAITVTIGAREHTP